MQINTDWYNFTPTIEKMTKAERTRQFIIERTAPIFNQKGFAGTSLNDITEATGLTKGSIYGNFENKDEVAIAVFHYNHQNFQNAFKQEIAKKESYKEKLMVFSTFYEKYFTALMARGGCPILNTAIEADDTHSVLKELANKALEKWKSSIISLIEKGIIAGEFKAKDIQTEQTALTIIALIEGSIMITKLSGNMGNMKLIMNSIKKIIDELT